MPFRQIFFGERRHPKWYQDKRERWYSSVPHISQKWVRSWGNFLAPQRPAKFHVSKVQGAAGWISKWIVKNLDIQNRGWSTKLVTDINSVVVQPQVLKKVAQKRVRGFKFSCAWRGRVGHAKRRDKDGVSHIISVRSGLIASRTM